MKSVVLDGHTLSPGDLSWASLERLTRLEVHSRASPPDIVPGANGAAILLTNETPLRADTLARMPVLKYIGVLAK